MFLKCLLITLVTTVYVTRMQATPVSTQGNDGRVMTCLEDGEYPNYYNCSTYIICSNGVQYVMPCPDGLIWNVETKACDWPANTSCVTYPKLWSSFYRNRV